MSTKGIDEKGPELVKFPKYYPGSESDSTSEEFSYAKPVPAAAPEVPLQKKLSGTGSSHTTFSSGEEVLKSSPLPPMLEFPPASKLFTGEITSVRLNDPAEPEVAVTVPSLTEEELRQREYVERWITSGGTYGDPDPDPNLSGQSLERPFEILNTDEGTKSHAESETTTSVNHHNLQVTLSSLNEGAGEDKKSEENGKPFVPMTEEEKAAHEEFLTARRQLPRPRLKKRRKHVLWNKVMYANFGQSDSW